MKTRTTAIAALAVLLCAPMANAVVVGGKDWRQLTETTNLTWVDVATVCSTATGACSGDVGGVSFSGWTWAAHTDVQALFDELIKPGSPQFPSQYSLYFAQNDSDIAAALGPLGFTPTGQDASRAIAYGYSRDELVPCCYAAVAGLTNWFNPALYDTASLIMFDTDKRTNEVGGFWMFRSVPEPGTLALLGLGLAGLGLTRRRKAN